MTCLTSITIALATTLALGCTTDPRDSSPGGGVDAPAGAVDARTQPPSDGAPSSIDGALPDAPPQPATMFPINGPSAAAPMIAGVSVTCHAQYSPKIVRVYVIVTDAQGATDRGTGSGTLVLPDGTMVGMTLPEPYSASQYDYRARFGTGENLSQAQYDQTCAAAQLHLSLTIADKTGHVTIAPSIVVAPAVGGTI